MCLLQNRFKVSTKNIIMASITPVRILWFCLYLFTRLTCNLLGLRFDGDRVVETWMQFPDVALVNFNNIVNIFFNFHASAPGLPILEALLKSVSDSHWQFLAQIIIYSLGVVSGLIILQSMDKQGVNPWLTLSVLVFTVALNPAMILFDNQFYSTSFVAYLLLVCIALLSKEHTRESEWVWFILILTLLMYLRPTFNFYLFIPVICYIMIKYIRNKLLIILLLVIAIIPISTAQIYRTLEFDSFTFSTSSTSGALAEFGFWDTPNTKENRAGYYPYQIRSEDLAIKLGNNPLLDVATKRNGLPNWNYRGYLSDFTADRSKSLDVVIHNLGSVPRFLKGGLRWAAIDPTCSRVITSESRSIIGTYSSVYSKVFQFEKPPQLKSTQLLTCSEESGTQYTYLLIISLYILLIANLFIQIVRRKFRLGFGYLVAVYLVSINFFAAYTNGSPEMSKYRMESEAALIILILIFLNSTIRKQKCLHL